MVIIISDIKQKPALALLHPLKCSIESRISQT